MCRKSLLQILLVVAITLVGTNTAFGVQSVDIRVYTTNDDAEEDVSSGSVGRTSSDLEMPYDGPGTPATGGQIIGIRWRDVAIKQGSIISEAWIEFECDETDPGTEAHVSLVIEGELDPNAATFAGQDLDITNRPRTTAKAVWAPVAWTAVSQKDRTSDISAIIEEIVGQDGWKSGNSLVVIISDDPANPSLGLRNAEAYDGESVNSPLLHIEYTSHYASIPSPADGTLYEDTWASLAWDAGGTAVTHDVYMSDNFDEVNDGAAAAFQGNQALTFLTVGFFGFPFPDGLVPGATYYWRVDEVEADGTTKYRGDVWSFSVASKTAYDPSPRDGGKAVDPDVTLAWTPGFGAKLHMVYFGDDFDTVSNATGALPDGDATYTPDTLEKDKVYYWRVDEFNPPETIKGDVWSFRTVPEIVITDPDLIGWWKLDTLRGTTVRDWSGYGNDGTTGGDPQLVEGVIEFGLDLDGDDYVMLDPVEDDFTSRSFTLSAWVKTRQGGEGNVIASNTGGSHALQFGVDNGSIWVDDGVADDDFPPQVNDDQWHMITLVKSGSNGYLYTDGVQVGKISTTVDVTTETRWSIGQEWDSEPSDFYVGVVDDVRIYNRALTPDEVVELMRGDPLVAWKPKPGNTAVMDVEQATQPLGWSAGDDAAEHDVYFGTDENAVNLADTSTADIYRGRQSGTSYAPPEPLEWDTGPYYWRVDEISADGSVSTGSLWSFSVADYLIVDDFESYNDIDEGEEGSNRLYLTWLDGFDNPAVNGAVVGNLNVPIAETRAGYVNGGAQAMPLSYNNSGKSSEATLALAGAARDWTRQGVGELSLWFRGEPTNAAERMYVALNGRAVYHNNPNAAQVDAYEEWVIPLQTFADLGVTLNNVTSVAIGFGTPGSTAAGGAGTMYIDDLRLYRVAP